MTDKTSKAGTDTRPLTTEMMQSAALAEIGGYAETTAALARVDERIRELRTDPGPAPPNVGELAGRLMGGEALAEAGELGTAITEHEGRVTARTREQQLLTAVRGELDRTRELALRSGSAPAFAWLDAKLHDLLDRARPILGNLGTVRDAEAALDSEHPTEARDGLRELQALADEYAILREAQVQLVGLVADHARTPRHLSWADQVALVRDHGLISNPGEAGTPPADPVQQLVWLLEGKPGPVAFVPGYAELLRRADAAQPAKPPRPDTIEDEQEPYLAAPGAAAARERRLQDRAVSVPRI